MSDLLVLALELGDQAAVMTVCNEGSEPALVWSRANSWGWGTTRLVLAPSGRMDKSVELHPPERIFTRNGPGVVEIPGHGRHRFELRPGEEGWIAHPPIDSLRGGDLVVRGVLDIPSSPESDELQVCVGRWESGPILSRPPHSWL